MGGDGSMVSETEHFRVAIVGGGPGGIFTASLLEEKYKDSYRTTVFEASHRTGGKILTRKFDSAPVIYEAGLAELYSYAAIGPDPLLHLIRTLGLKTVPMKGKAVVLNERILRDQRDIQRLCGRVTLDAIRKFRARCREAMPLEAWYEGNWHHDNMHSWCGQSCEEILDEVPDPQARKYLKVSAHSDLATEPHLTDGLNGLKNFLMDVPGYIRLYSVVGGIEQVPSALRERLRHTRVEVDSPVTRIEKNPDETYRVSWRRSGVIVHEDFEVVFVALPHNWLGAIEWGGEPLRKAMTRFIAYYDRPGHYLRVTCLFQKPFWRDQIGGSWFMLDAFGGCCVYDEGTRYDAGQFGVLSWLIAGTDALSMSGLDDRTLARAVMATLPKPLDREAASLFVEAHVHRWAASVSAQPGGLPVRATKSAHLPEPREHPGLFMVGDYLFDSTLNGVLDSAAFATDLLNSWVLKRRLLDTPARAKNLAGRSSLSTVSTQPAPAGRLKRQRMNRDYFDRYHEDLSYEDAYDWYFDAKYVQDLIQIVWKAKPPYRLLDAGSASGLTLGDFAKRGIAAWGVENNKYIHDRTPAKWRKRNLLGDVRKLPFPDNHFDFVYETCLAYIPEKQIPRAIGELHRVSRRGVIFASITSDMNPELLMRRDLLGGMKSLMTLWEWGELFAAAGFAVAASDDKTLERLWRCEKKYNEDDPDWYPNRESLRYCFYTPKI